MRALAHYHDDIISKLLFFQQEVKENFVFTKNGENVDFVMFKSSSNCTLL